MPIMDIRSINSGLTPTEAVNRRRAEEADDAAAGNPAIQSRDGQGATTDDAVRISQGGSVSTSESTDVQVARTALAHAEGLSDERRAEIQARHDRHSR